MTPERHQAAVELLQETIKDWKVTLAAAQNSLAATGSTCWVDEINRCASRIKAAKDAIEIVEAAMWRPIQSAPRDGSEIEILFDSAEVDVIRLCWWLGPENPEWENSTKYNFATSEDIGWWSYKHSVTQEQLTYLEAIAWRPFSKPELPVGPKEGK